MTVSVFARGNQFLREGRLEEAIASYQKAIELNPQFAWSYQNLGDALEKVGRRDEAIAVFRRSVANCPESPWPFYKLGVILGQQGKFQEGVGYLRRAVELKNDVPEFYLGLGTGLVKLEQWSQAVECINQAVGMWGGTVGTLYGMSLQAEADFYLAEAKSGQGQWSEAVEFYGRSWEVNPGRVDCCMGWTKALGKLGRWSEAVELYRQGAALFEEHGELWLSLGKALGQLERWEEAVVEYERAVGLGFAGAEVRHNLGFALGQLGRWEEAIVQYRLVVEVNQRSAEVTHQLGYALMRLGRWGEAETELRKAAELHPGSAVVWQHLGYVLGELGEKDEAESAYKRALELKPNNKKLKQDLQPNINELLWIKDSHLDKLIKGGDDSQEITVSQNQTAAQPDNYKAYYELGLALETKGLLDEAIAYYQKAIKIHPNFGKCYHSLGNALAGKNHLDEAVIAYHKAIEFNPNALMSLYRLGNVLTKQEKWEEAIQMYQKTIEIDPDFSKSYDELIKILTVQERWDDLIILCQNRLSVNPNSANLHHVLGYALAQVGDYEQAEQSYRQALNLNPQWDIVYRHLRQALEKQGKHQAASELSRQQTYSNVLKSKFDSQFEDNNLNSQVLPGDFSSSFKLFQNLQRLPKVLPTTWDERTGRRLSMIDTYQQTYNYGRKVSDRLVDIVVCVYNALEDVKVCLNSVVECTQNFRLIIVDDCSDWETQSFLQEFVVKFPEHILVRNKINLGYTKSANNGLMLSNADYVVLLNSDVIVTSNWLEKMIQCFESDEQIGVVGPLSNCASWQSIPELFDENGDWKINTLPNGFTLEKFSKLVEELSEGSFPQVQLINGFCYMIKAEVLNFIGCLDELNFPYGYGEENDFSLRVHKAGFKLVIADNVYLYHSKSKSFGHNRRRELGKQGKAALNQKYPDTSFKKLTDEIRYNHNLEKLRERLRETLKNTA